jgi:DNA-binding transcriptional LysR family regulator
MKHLHTTLPGLISAVQVADSGSFTAAAKTLDLTSAAVSKNVAKLEALLKVRLFNRTTRRLSLTEEGKAFIADARAGLGVLDDAARNAAQGLKPQGMVRINCPVGFGRNYILPALPYFYRNYPDVQLDLHLNDQAVDLVGQGFDIGIRGGSQPPDGMVARKIFDISVIVVASPAYLAARGTPVRSAELAGHDLIKVKFLNGRTMPWVFNEPINGVDHAVTFNGQAKLLVSDPDVAVEAALSHLGITHVGSYHAYEGLKRGDLVEVLPAQRAASGISMSMFYPHRTGLAPRVRVTVDYLLGHFAKVPALRPQRSLQLSPKAPPGFGRAAPVR